MYIDKALSEDVDFIADNLCEKAIEELQAMFGADYRKEFLEQLYEIPLSNIRTVKLKENNEAVAILGLIPQSKNCAGIFFLSTENLHKGNMITFLRGAKEVINFWNDEFKLLLDKWYIKNNLVRKWLKSLGFIPSDILEDNNFQIYYKGDINEYY